MKTGSTLSLSFALALGMLICPNFAPAQATDATQQAAQPSSSQIQAQQEAAQMVPAAANLKSAINARKVHPGSQFEATLDHDVQLKNGPELKSGTVLIGQVTQDQMQRGDARLALRFTRAQLKDGQMVPIKATVLQLTAPAADTGINLAGESDLWQGHTLRVDELGAIKNVDMHSNIASKDSAVLVSQKDNDVKLSSNSQMVLAIAEQPNGQRSGGY